MHLPASGDFAYLCAKNYNVTYTCNGITKTAYAAPVQNETYVVSLSCVPSNCQPSCTGKADGTDNGCGQVCCTHQQSSCPNGQSICNTNPQCEAWVSCYYYPSQVAQPGYCNDYLDDVTEL